MFFLGYCSARNDKNGTRHPVDTILTEIDSVMDMAGLSVLDKIMTIANRYPVSSAPLIEQKPRDGPPEQETVSQLEERLQQLRLKD
jgi:hypothetical protein